MENIYIYLKNANEEMHMANKKITYHDVCAVADSIYSRGELPTVASVQKILSQGSLADIGKHLKAWENFKSANRGVLDGTNHMPPAVSLAVQDVLIHTQNDEKTPENTVFDTVVNKQTESQMQVGMAELVKENRILAEKITQVTQEKEALAEQLKKLQTDMQNILKKYEA
jgi:predicted RNase H-like nuclease (RuvC/YqgF family)